MQGKPLIDNAIKQNMHCEITISSKFFIRRSIKHLKYLSLVEEDKGFHNKMIQSAGFLITQKQSSVTS